MIFVREKSFYKKFALIAIPVVLQSCITIGINMMDTIMLGSFGEGYLSATSLSNQFYNFYQIICMGLGGGAAVLAGQAWGRKDPEAICKVLTIMLRLTLSVGLLFTLVTCFFPDKIMSIYTSDASVLHDCVRYYKFLCFSFIFQGISLSLTNVLRATGKTFIPLLSSIGAFFINIFFNYCFIFGAFFFPRLEITGAAIGTLIARIFEALFILSYLLYVDKDIHYRISSFFQPCKEYIPDYIQYGLPVLISDFLLGLGNNMLAIIMGHISAVFVAAFSITSVAQQMTTVFTQGVTFSSSAMTSQTVGAGKVETAYNQGKTFFSLAAIIGIISSCLIFLFNDVIISMYNIQADTIDTAYQLIHSLCITLPFMMVGSVMTKGVLRGGGDTRFLLVADICFLWFASIPLGALSGLVLHMNAFWVFFFLRIDHIIKSIWCISRFKSKKWIHVMKKAS